MKNILLSIALAVLIWSACSKSIPPDDDYNTPVFSVALSSGFQDTSLTAGINGIYLFTRVEHLDSVLVMSGTFNNVSCQDENCPGNIRFEFRNNSIENFTEPSFIFGPDHEWNFKSPSTFYPYYSTVSIRWVTSYGDIIRSDLISQPSDTSTYINIQQSGPWENNERGEKTWKMNVSFSCLMLDSMTSQEQQVTGSGVIAVGYR